MPVCPECEQGMTPASIQWEDGSMTHGVWLCGCREKTDGAILVRHSEPIRYVYRVEPNGFRGLNLHHLLQGATVYVVPRRGATHDQMNAARHAIRHAIRVIGAVTQHPVPNNWRAECRGAVQMLDSALRKIEGERPMEGTTHV